MESRKLHQFDILVKWFEEHLTLKNYRPRTIKDYLFELSLFRRWLETLPEVADLDDLMKEHITDFTAGLYQRQLAVTTISHKLAILKSFFTLIYTENKLYRNFADIIIMPRIGRRLPRNILTIEEIDLLFNRLEEKSDFAEVTSFTQAVELRDRAVIELFYSCGLRLTELLQLTPDNVNYDQALLFVKEGKGAKDRVVPIGAVALRALKRYVQEGRKFLLTEENRMWLFLSRRGKVLGENSIRRYLKRSLLEAGVEKHIRIHDLRHTCATHMLNNGADIRYVQELLGHKELSSTQIYTHVSIEDLKKKHEKFHPREKWRE